MKNKSNRWLRLIIDCLIELKKHNVNVVFSKHPVYIKDEDIYTFGYWDDTNPKKPLLACQVTNDESEWVPIFAHEYCHFLQWREKCVEWKNANSISDKHMYKITHNKPIKKRYLEKQLNNLRDLELDCEKRTVRLFKKYKVPVKLKKYIAEANSYVHFYNYIKDYRKWYPKNNKPYKNELLAKACSGNFYSSYEKIPKKLKMAYERVYPVKEKSKLK